MLKYVLSGAMLVAVTTPLMAQEFYIVRQPNQTTCTVVEQRPAASTQITVIGDKVYKTRAEADAAIKTVCVTR